MLKSPLSKSLRAIVAALEGLDERELNALVTGKGKLVFVATEQSPEIAEAASIDTGYVLERLQSCKDRHEARAVLIDITSKETLSALAKSQKIHVAKHDRREDIENKIIEFLVGGKLRSQAIQSLNMKGNSVPINGPQEAV